MVEELLDDDIGPEVVRVKPFREYIEQGSERPALMVVGRIDGDRFVLHVLGSGIPLPTTWVAREPDEPCALVSVGEWRSGDLRISVEPEYEPEMRTGGSITVRWGPDPRAQADDELRRQGIDPGAVLLAVAGGNHLAIFFDWEGAVDGTVHSERPAGPETHH